MSFELICGEKDAPRAGCSLCGQKGKVKCPNCGGTGRIVCSICRGDGKAWGGVGADCPCQSEGGADLTTCQACEGRRDVPCSCVCEARYVWKDAKSLLGHLIPTTVMAEFRKDEWQFFYRDPGQEPWIALPASDTVRQKLDQAIWKARELKDNVRIELRSLVDELPDECLQTALEQMKSFLPG